MKKLKLQTPKTKTALPRHEHAARRARAKALAHAVPRQPGHVTTAILPPALQRHPSGE